VRSSKDNLSNRFDFYYYVRKVALAMLGFISWPVLSKRYEHIDHWIRKRRSANIVTAQRDGISYRLDLRQLIDDRIYYDGCFEEAAVDIFSKVVRAGMTVFDIGANIGAHTFHLARIVGETGRVYAFEPTSWAFQRFSTNLELNQELKNIYAMNIALGDENVGRQEYQFRAQWRQDGEWVESEVGVAEFLTLDRFCQDSRLRKVDFIKHDVDGYETKILMGAAEILRRDRPVLIVEMSDFYQRLAGNSFEELATILDRFNYHYHSETDFTLIEDVRTYIEKLNDWDTVNVVCIPPEKCS
jgi:FkbM family methyltransferase